jgi:hypothetical protein
MARRRRRLGASAAYYIADLVEEHDRLAADDRPISLTSAKGLMSDPVKQGPPAPRTVVVEIRGNTLVVRTRPGRR